MSQKLSIAFFAVLFSLTAFAGLEEDYLAIKDSGRSLEPQGAICEEVAKLRFQEKYPEPMFSVITGISYSEKFGTLGELDIIVFDNQTDSAVAVSEVKCWKNQKQGLEKAIDQRLRFINNIHSGKNLKFKWEFDETKAFTKGQFLNIKSFTSIGQKGAVEAGYDEELEYTLKELMQLRSRILRCQDLEGCKKPTY